MAADKEGGGLRLDKSQCPAVVPAGIASDVGEQDIGSFTFEPLYQRAGTSNAVVVDIACHSHQGTESRQGVEGFQISDVARMPYLLAGFEKPEDFWIEISVCV